MNGHVKRKSGSGSKRAVRTPKLVKDVNFSEFSNEENRYINLTVSEHTIRNVIRKSRTRIKKYLKCSSEKF